MEASGASPLIFGPSYTQPKLIVHALRFPALLLAVPPRQELGGARPLLALDLLHERARLPDVLADTLHLAGYIVVHAVEEVEQIDDRAMGWPGVQGQ